MKKTNFWAATMVVVALVSGTMSYAADNDAIEKAFKNRVPVTKEMPKLYDKNGNELKAPPKPGEAVYDKNGKQLPPPPCIKDRHPKGPDLNLSEEQKLTADKMREESRKKMKPIRKEIHKLKNQIWEINENDKLTIEQKQEKIKPLIKKIDALRDKADTIRQEDMKQFEQILTDEQKKILEEFKKTHKPPMKRPHHPRFE